MQIGMARGLQDHAVGIPMKPKRRSALQRARILVVEDENLLAWSIAQALEKAGLVERGIYLIRSQIEDILKKRGLEKVSVKPGDAFDPMIAEAMAEVPSQAPVGAVVEAIEPGYRLHDKMLRPARVIISKGQ